MSLNGLRLVRTNEGWSSTVIGLVSLDRLTHQLRTVKIRISSLTMRS
jgi:hypothetical protein